MLYRLSQNPLILAFVVGTISFATIAGLRAIGAVEWLELFAYDLLVQFRQKDMVERESILIVGVSEFDIAEYGWPLSDAVLATSLQEIAESRPMAIGVDLYRDQPIPPGSERLSEILSSSRNVVWASKFGDEATPGIPPPAGLQDSERYGFADIVQDSDGIIRRGLLFLDDGQNFEFSFPLRLALVFLESKEIYPAPDETIPEHLRLGKVTLPPLEPGFGGYAEEDFSGYQYMIDFREGLSPFPMVSLGDLLGGRVPSDSIRDKIVLIGVTAESVKDYFHTPLTRNSEGLGITYGAVLQAKMTNQLLRHALEGIEPTRALDERLSLVWIFAWSLVGGLLVKQFNSPWRFSIAFAALILSYGLVAHFALQQSLWLPAASGLLGTGLSVASTAFIFFRFERRQRSLLMSLFSTHVAKEVADEIWRQRHEFLENGRPRPQRQIATVLFSDIKNFTTISERLEPHTLMEWLNAYMDSMAKVVAESGGMVEKFIGDAVMALFGVPVARTTENQIAEDAKNAALCALAMRAEIDRLNMTYDKAALPRITVRVGIFTGPLVAGELGTADRMQYTVIGDTVNTAARLEGFAKVLEKEDTDGGCYIVVGETTAARLDSKFSTALLGDVELKGKEEKIAAYELKGYNDVTS